jgi:hypothetical protein
MEKGLFNTSERLTKRRSCGPGRLDFDNFSVIRWGLGVTSYDQSMEAIRGAFL